MSSQTQGATLAEVVLALGLCVVVVLSCIQMGLIATRANAKTADVLASEALAENTLSQFIYSLPPAGAPFWTTATFNSPYQQDTLTLGTQTFSRVLYVHDKAAMAPGLRLIQVRVRWNAGAQDRAGQGDQTTEVARLVSAP